MVDANEICTYWLESPPTHVSLSAIVRAFSPKKTRRSVFEGLPRAAAARIGTDDEAAAFASQLKAFASDMARPTRG
jgi:hypothetical protein